MYYKPGDIHHKKHYQFQAQRMNYCAEEKLLTHAGNEVGPVLIEPFEDDIVKTNINNNNNNANNDNNNNNDSKINEDNEAIKEKKDNENDKDSWTKSSIGKKTEKANNEGDANDNKEEEKEEQPDYEDGSGVNKYPQTAHLLNCIHGSVIFENMEHLHQGIILLLTYCRDHKEYMELIGMDNPFNEHKAWWSALQKTKSDASEIELDNNSSNNNNSNNNNNNNENDNETDDVDNKKENEINDNKIGKNNNSRKKKKRRTSSISSLMSGGTSEKIKKRTFSHYLSNKDRDKLPRISDYQCIQFYVAIKHSQRAMICQIRFILKCMLEFRQQTRQFSIIKNYYHPLVKGTFHHLTCGLGMDHNKLRNHHWNFNANNNITTNNHPNSNLLISVPNLGPKSSDPKSKGATKRNKTDSQKNSPVLKTRYGSSGNILVNRTARSGSTGSESRSSSVRLQDLQAALGLSGITKRMSVTIIIIIIITI
ncbi:hypothetical protein RFI_06807, partial [Reticulomyxa filosa]